MSKNIKCILIINDSPRTNSRIPQTREEKSGLNNTTPIALGRSITRDGKVSCVLPEEIIARFKYILSLQIVGNHHTLETRIKEEVVNNILNTPNLKDLLINGRITLGSQNNHL